MSHLHAVATAAGPILAAVLHHRRHDGFAGALLIVIVVGGGVYYLSRRQGRWRDRDAPRRDDSHWDS